VSWTFLVPVGGHATLRTFTDNFVPPLAVRQEVFGHHYHVDFCGNVVYLPHHDNQWVSSWMDEHGVSKCMVPTSPNLTSFPCSKHPGRMKQVYYPTHIRMHAWLVGIIVGYILHQTKHRRFQLSRTQIWAGWTCAMAVILGLLIGSHPLQQLDYSGPFVYDAVYEATSRVLWSTAIGWIIFACVNGYGGWANSILSWPAFQPLGKLSYSIYLVHMVVQTVASAAIRHPRYFTNTTVLHSTWGDFGLTLTICLLWSLAFESPIAIIEKYLFRLFQRPSRPTQPPATAINGSLDTLTISKEC
jgi:Acyltransferase family